MMDIISTYDIILVIIYLIILFIISSIIRNKYIKRYKEYKYFNRGLVAKIIGVITFCLIYVYYYKGGDTINYFFGSKTIVNLLFQDFNKGINVLFNTESPLNNWNSFNYETGFPPHYMWKDSNTFAVCRFSTIFVLLSFNSFLVASILVSVFSYIGIWKMYRLFNILYPNYYRGLAYIVLFLPTLVFWGSGIMKDSYILGATCWMTYSFYKIFIDRKKVILNCIFFAFNLLIILNTKTYVLLSLIPGMLLWLNSAYLKKISNNFTKIFLFPFLLFFIFLIGYFSFSNIEQYMGVYGNVDSAFEQAQIVQQDLLRQEAYGSNSYNIGEIDGTIGGMLLLAPVAVFTAIYRPMFWEIGSPIMIISAIENIILLIFTIFLLIRTNPFRMLRIIFKEPILLYAFVFSLLFAFGVGVAGTNFGALVRYKVPLVPFYFTMLYLVYKISRAK